MATNKTVLQLGTITSPLAADKMLIIEAGVPYQIALSDLAAYIGGGSGAAILTKSTVPTSPTSTGTQGNISWDSNYFYICTAANTWRRWAIATW